MNFYAHQVVQSLRPLFANKRRLLTTGGGTTTFVLGGSMWGSRNVDNVKDADKSIAEIIARADVYYAQYMIDNVYTGLIR